MALGSSSEKGIRTVLVHEFVTGGGLAGQRVPPSLAIEGSAMRRAIATDLAAIPGIQVVMTLDKHLKAEPGPWQLVPVGQGDEQSKLLSLARTCDAVLVIAPETQGILASREELVRTGGGHSLGSTPVAIALATDKLETCRWLAKHGLPVVPGLRLDPGLPWPTHRPERAVLKPVDGAGSLDTTYLGPDDPWPTANPPAMPTILQPFLEGTPASLSFLIHPAQGNDPGWIKLMGTATQQMVRHGNTFSYQGGRIPAVIPTPVIMQLVETLPLWEGLAGWVGIDLIISPDQTQATILEVNPRLTTSYVGLRRWVKGGGTALANGLLQSLWPGTPEPTNGHFWTHAQAGVTGIEFQATGHVTVLREGNPR